MSVSSLLGRKITLAVLILGLCSMARGTVINVTTNDNYTKIESAKAGDEVVIAPGTYKFRVYLTKQASPTNPIVIRALDPANRPVWDFTNTLVESAPGSYGAGDRGRGGWQFSGASGYRVSGIIFRNCRTASFNSAAIRFYNSSTNLYIKDCLFELNDDGLTGGTQDSQATVEFCEFNANGNTNASMSSPTHNIYVYGGYLTLRYCYVHDPVQGQNFHIRCREATLEYNWFARAKSYEGDLMSDDDFTGAGPYTQTMTLRGNIIVQSTSPLNNSQEIAMYNDESTPGLTLNLRALFNTFVGNGASTAFVHVSNADHTQMNAELSDNIISGTTRPYLIEYTNTGIVTGWNNWLKTGVTAASLSNTVQSTSAGFRNAATKDYTLTNTSVCIGAATATVYGLPGKEYWRNETNNCQWRIRAAAHDIGAFESTSTNNPVGPYDTDPRPLLSVVTGAGCVTAAWPLFAQDYQVQQSPLMIPATWSDASVVMMTNATGVVATVTSSANSLFRLKGAR